MALTGIATLLIESLWGVARQKHLGRPAGAVLALDQPLTELLSRPPGAWIRSVRRVLQYEGEQERTWRLEVE